MWRPDLWDWEMVHYLEALDRGYDRQIRASILRVSDESYVGPLDNLLLDGQVTFDTEAETSRVLSLRIVDKTRGLVFEPSGPSSAAVHRKFMLRVSWSTRVPKLERWVTVPVFTGPIWDVDRVGAEVTITGHGKERLALGAPNETRSYWRKAKTTWVARDILAQCGIQRMVIPDLPHKLGEPLTLIRGDDDPAHTSWGEHEALAASVGRYPLFDGAGTLRWRRYTNRPVHDFTRTLMTEPRTFRSAEGLYNSFEVLGAKPKGSKKRVRGYAVFPKSNPNSPYALRHHDAWHRLWLREENERFKTERAANERARHNRDEALKRTTDYELNVVPWPLLEEGDMVAAALVGGGMQVSRAKQWTLPLGGSEAGGAEGPAMTIGGAKRSMSTGRGGHW